MRAVTVSILPVVIIGQWLAAARAVAGAPSIENVAPGVGQRGTEFQLRLSERDWPRPRICSSIPQASCAPDSRRCLTTR